MKSEREKLREKMRKFSLIDTIMNLYTMYIYSSEPKHPKQSLTN